MAEENDNSEPVVVSTVSRRRGRNKWAEGAEVRPSSNLNARRSTKDKAAMSIRSKTGSNFGFGGGSFGFGGSTGGGVVRGDAQNIYSPHLSTDFLELPQTMSERRAYYRHFYQNDPYVGAAIDLHTELPLSKIRLTMPSSEDDEKNREVLKFHERMIDRMGLLETLVDATREYHVVGEAFIFHEDHEINIPDELIEYEVTRELDIDDGGKPREHKNLTEESRERIHKYVRNNYEGWKDMTVLPPDRVNVENIQWSKQTLMELEPDEKTEKLVHRAATDPEAAEKVKHVPDEIREYIERGENLPLDTDPYEGSFCYQLARNKPDFKEHGTSALQRVLRTLVHRDKLRQAQASIASRAMTPKRIIWAEDLDVDDVDDLRWQVNESLEDPDYSIITNYQVNWEEKTGDNRLLNLSGEYDIIEKELFAGLGVTRSMLTGESMYSGEKINLEVINNKYMLFRERIQDYVQKNLLKPVSKKKGWVEQDEFGNSHIIHPNLEFTRLAIRDNRDTFDTMFNLYQKGSLSVGYILELFNLDPKAVRERLEDDLFTINDPTFNEMIRNIYSEVGRNIVESSDIPEEFVTYINNATDMDITYEEEEEDGGGRF